MTSNFDTVNDAAALTIAALVDSIGRVLEAQVAMIVVQDPDGRMSAMPCPGYEVDVLRWAEGANWRSAIRIAEEHSRRQ